MAVALCQIRLQPRLCGVGFSLALGLLPPLVETLEAPSVPRIRSTHAPVEEALPCGSCSQSYPCPQGLRTPQNLLAHGTDQDHHRQKNQNRKRKSRRE